MAFRAALHQAGERPSVSCCSSPSLPPTSAPSPAHAAVRRTTANCARGAFSLLWAKWN